MNPQDQQRIDAEIAANPAPGTELYNQRQAGAASATPNVAPARSNVITPEDLAPVTPFKLSPQKQSTDAAGFGAEITSRNNQDFTAQQAEEQRIAQENEKLNAAEQKMNASGKTLFARMFGTKGGTALTDEAYSSKNTLGTTVDETSKKLKDVNAKINAIDIRANEEIKQIEKNTNGMFGGAVQQERDRVIRQASSDKADLYIEKLVAQGDFDSAKNIADRKVAMILEKDKIEIEALKFDYEENKEQFTKVEQRQFEQVTRDRERALDQKERELKGVNDIALQYMKEGGNQATFQQILKSKTQAEALALAGNMLGLRDRRMQDLQMANLQSQINERSNKGMAIDVSSIISNPNIPSEQKNGAVLTSILGNTKIGQGTRTQIANVLGVVNATQELAGTRQTTGFKGINPFNAIADIKIPFTNIGLPFRQSVMGTEAAENRQYLEAINLKVQQWASGASLTEKQTDQVEKLTPRPTDTDNKLRTKMNGLVNFMLTQAQSQLQSEGIGYIPEKVNLFETYDLIKKATPEQLAELKAQGLIQ